MARDRDTTEESNESILGRRSYLKLAGAAAASTVATNAAGRVSAAKQSGDAVNIVDEGADSNGDEPIDSVLNDVVSDGATIHFPSGTYLIDSFNTSANNVTFRGDDAKLCPSGSPGSLLKFEGNGWTFDGFTLDATQQSSATPKSWLATTGQGWEVKNVTCKGKLTGGERFFLPYVPSEDGKGVYKNITAKDGSEHDTAGCFYVHEPHEGELVLDNVDVRNFGSRGIYHSGASPGTTRILNSHWEDNRINVRFGGHNCELKNSTVKQTVNKRGPDYCVWLRANKKRPSGAVHAEAYGAVIENCDLVVDGTESNETPDQASAISVGGGSNGYFGSFEVRDTRIRVKGANAAAGIDANDNMQPEGISGSVPKTKGTIKNVSITTDEGVAGIQMERDGKVTNCCISSDGEALNFQGVDVSTAKINTDGSCPLPSLKGGKKKSDAKKKAKAGSESDSESDAVTKKSESNSDLPNTISITSKSGDLVKYKFSVTETAKKSTARNASKNSEDSISDGTVTGTVAGSSVSVDSGFNLDNALSGGDTDSYQFAGEIDKFEVNGDATVYLNGSEVDPSTLGAKSSGNSKLSKTIVIDGTNRSKPSKYSFAVDGKIEKSEKIGVVSDEDTISNGRAKGAVAGAKDGYRFSGNITQFRLDGSASVRFEENE